MKSMKFLENVEHILCYGENQFWRNDGIFVEYFDEEWVVSYQNNDIPCESKEEAFSTAEKLMMMKEKNRTNIINAAAWIVTMSHRQPMAH